MELGLKGRTALVTGARKGIGRAIARGLASEGVNLILLARGKDALETTAGELQSKYGVKALVWFETHEDVNEAITREKQIKEWKREWKVEMIERSNPYWRDLHPELLA